MPTAIRPLPQQEGSPHDVQPHTTKSLQLNLGGRSEGDMEAKGAPPTKRHHDFTVPIKPPSESNKNTFSSSSVAKCQGATSFATRPARSGSTNSSNPTSGKGQQQKPIGVLKAERRYSRSPDTIGAAAAVVQAVTEETSHSAANSEFAVISAVGSSARTNRSAISGITTISGDDTGTGDTSGIDFFENGRNAGGRGGMSGNLLEPGGTHQVTSVDDLERRLAVLTGDGGDSCARTIAIRGADAHGSDESDYRNNRTPDSTTFGNNAVPAPKQMTQKSPKITSSPLKEMTRQEQMKQIQIEREQLEERSAHPDKIHNPFGRPLPREHAYSSRHLQKSIICQGSEPEHSVMVLKPMIGTNRVATAGSRISAHERAERFTAITASTAPTTTISSEGGWLDRHLRALGGKKPAGRDVRVFEIEEGRELTSDEIQSLRSKTSAATKSKKFTRTKGVSSAAAAVLQEEHAVYGAERWFSAPPVPDDVSADVQTHGGETVGTMGEETAGAAMLGFTHQLQSAAIATTPLSMVKQKPWKKQNQQQKQKRHPTFNDEAEKAREKRERRLEKAVNRELDKEAAKTLRKESERQRKRQEQADASRLRKRSRVAEAGAEGRGIASVYTSGESAGGDTRPTVSNVLSSYQLLRSRQASRPLIGNLEVLDKDAMALERDIWQGIDEMMRDAMPMTPRDDGGTVYSADALQVPNSEVSKHDASSSYYSRYSTRSHGTAGSTLTTRSRAWDTVSRLGDTVVSRADKSDAASPSSDDIGEILLAKSALQGFISFFGEQDASEKPSSEELHDSMGDLTDYTREEVVAATRELPGHSVRSILKYDSKELKSRQAKQRLVLEGLLELSSRSLGETKKDEEKESDDAEHSLGSMDDYMLGQVALDAFADVLIGKRQEDASRPSDDLPVGTSSAQLLDLSHEKKALLHDEQLTLLFEVFRWSLAVNIDANIRNMGKEERLLRHNDRGSMRKQKSGNRRSRKSKRRHSQGSNSSPSKLDEEELKRQTALAIDDVGTVVETKEERPLCGSIDGVDSSSSSDDEISSPEGGVMNYGDCGDNNVDDVEQKRLWKKGLKLENKRSECALNPLSAASHLGLVTSSAKRGENEICSQEDSSIEATDLQHSHSNASTFTGGEDHYYHMSRSSAESGDTDIIGNTMVRERIASTTLSLVPEESEKSSPYTSQTSSIFDAEKGIHGLYANIERWENDEDGDSSAQEDAASAAFALISSAAVPGAKMPTARPIIPRTSQSPQRSDLSGATPQSDTTSNSTSTFGLSRSGSARSKASGLSSAALASSRQSSGLESIPEQDVESAIALSTRSFGSAVTVPDDDSSEKIYEDLKRIRDKYGLDDDEITAASRASTGRGGYNMAMPQDNHLRSSSDSAADIIHSLRDISARYGFDLLEDRKSSSRNGAPDEKRKKKLSSSDDVLNMGDSSSTYEKRSTATSQMKKSNSQSTKATNRTQQSVQFAEDYDTRGKDKEERELDSYADSEDSFLNWKMSVKSMYSEASKTSHTEEKKDSANEGAASTLLGAFREDSGLTVGISEGTSKVSDNDPVLNAFMESTNGRVSRHSLSSASTGLSQSTAGGSAMRTTNANKLMNALTQEQRESGTTRSSSRPNSSSIFYSSSTTRGSTASILQSSSATQRNVLQPGWDSCPPRPSLKRSASADRMSSGTLTNAHSSAAVASGFASSTSKTTGTHSGSTSNNYQSSFGTVSGPHSSGAVCSSKTGETGETGDKDSNDTSSRSTIGNPEFFSSADGYVTNDARKEAYPHTCNHQFDPISITSTLFDPLASSKERLDMRAKSRSKSASRGASSQSDRVPMGNDMTPLNHEGRMVSPLKMPRRYSDSSVVSVGAGSGGGDGNGMDSLFASVKKSFARGKGETGE